MTESNYAEMKAALAGAVIAGPAEEATIAQAEQLLGVRFPPSYRSFLSEFGAALCEGFELAGLFVQEDESRPPQWMDVVKSTHQLRRGSDDLIPREYIPVSGDGGDYIYYIDTSVIGPDGESPVIALGPGVDGVVIAESFSDYVIRASRGQIRF